MSSACDSMTTGISAGLIFARLAETPDSADRKAIPPPALPTRCGGSTVSLVSGFPVFDLARFEAASPQEKSALAADVDVVCRKTGFLAVSGHGVSQATIEAIWTRAEAFFALPLEQKLAAKAPYPGYPYGYLAPESESLARSRGVEAPPDQKESFNGGPERASPGLSDPEALGFCFAPTIWPEAPLGFREAWRAYYRAMEGLAARIMRVFALALKLPEDFFASFIDAPVSALRALNYPALLSRREARSDPRRRAHGLWQPHDPPAAGRIAGPGNSHAGREVGRGSAAPRRLRRQHRRSHGALDQRPLDLDAAPRRDPGGRRRGAAPVLRLLPSTELGRRDRGARRLPFARRAAEISARPLGAVSHGQVQVDDGLLARWRIYVRSVWRLRFRSASPICRATPQADFTRLLIQGVAPVARSPRFT